MLNKRGYSRFIFPVLFLLLAGVWLSFPKKVGVFPLDDSYIHLAYARNLSELGSFCFNPGEASLGSSSPLWVAVLAGFRRLGADLSWTALLLPLVCFGGLVYLAADTVKSAAEKLGWSAAKIQVGTFLTGTLLIINGNLIWYTLSGMETTFFLCLCFLTIKLYTRRGLDCLTGIFCGLVFLTRAPGGMLAVVLLLFELLRKNKGFYKGLIAMGVVILPYSLLSLTITGNLFPTTAQGKLLTYVDGGFHLKRIYWYLKTLFLYQQYQPQNYLLLSFCVITAGKLFKNYRGRWKKFKKIILNDHLEVVVLLVWGALHLSLYAVSFRILIHHSRYLANEYIILAVLGTLSLLYLFKNTTKIKEGLFWGGCCLLLTGGTLLFWQKVYYLNVKQVEDVYIRMSEWINRNTPPDSRIAAFDIGVLRYVGDRYAVDVGGLVDQSVHPFLEKHECGQYLRQKKTDYILYSRNLETDVWSGIYRAESQGEMLMKQIPVIHFETRQYEAPTLTHSYRMDLNRLIGWFPRTKAGVLEALSYDGRPLVELNESIDEKLRLAGYAIDQRVIEKIPCYPYAVNLTFFYKAVKVLENDYWAYISFINPENNTTVFSYRRVLTGNLLSPHNWPVGRLIQEHHFLFLPMNLPVMKYRIRLTFSQDVNVTDIEGKEGIDLGWFENIGNRLKPMDHMQRMVLSESL